MHWSEAIGDSTAAQRPPLALPEVYLEVGQSEGKYFGMVIVFRRDLVFQLIDRVLLCGVCWRRYEQITVSS